ncbi:hypothetical protein Tco_1527491 [Tanacetum coccineum]
MAGTGPSNLVARRAIDDLADFSGETAVLKNYIAQLNAMIAEMEAIKDQEEVYDSLICLKDDRWCRIFTKGQKRSQNNKTEHGFGKSAKN